MRVFFKEVIELGYGERKKIIKFVKIWWCNFKALFRCTWALVSKKCYDVIVFLQNELCFTEISFFDKKFCLRIYITVGNI